MRNPRSRELRFSTFLGIVFLAFTLAACSGDDGKDGADGAPGADGTDGFNSLVNVYDVPVGDAVCLGGGQAIDSGLDTNRNDILDDDEVLATEYFECAVTPTLRALHASPDAPKVNIIIDGTEALSAVDFNQGSGFVGVGQADNVTETGADVNVQVEGILPGDDAIVLDATLPLAFGTETTVIASGTIGDNDFGPILVTNPIGEPIADGSFRARDVGKMTQEQALKWGVTGPNLRATGLAFDVRRDDPYLVYDQLEFDIPTEQAGDAWARTLVRRNELLQSIRILRQVIERLPAISGPIRAPIPNPLAWKVPAGETYVRIESSKGELGWYVVSNGSEKPYRVHIRGPS